MLGLRVPAKSLPARALCALVLASCADRSPKNGVSVPDATRPAPSERRFAEGEWVIKWRLGGGSPQDSTVINPAMIAASNRHIFVYDFGATRLLVLDLDGKLVAKVGHRGAGPGEFGRVAAIAANQAGDNAVVLDPENTRLTVVGGDGGVQGEAQVILSGLPTGVVALDSGLTIVVSTERVGAMRVVDRKGREVASADSPWLGVDKVPSIARQSYVASDGRGQWVLAYMLAGAWFPFERLRFLNAIGGTVDGPRDFPPVTRTVKGGTTSEYFEKYTPCLTCDAALDDKRVYLLTGETDATPRQVLDVFSFVTGDYIESLKLPMAVRFFTKRGPLFVLSVDDPEPEVVGLMFERKRGPAH